MAKYRINMALWQVPTMVVNIPKKPDEEAYTRTLANTMAHLPLTDRVELLRKRIRKADDFFRTTPGPLDRHNVTVFAAPEYLFAKSDARHFIDEDEKDRLVKALCAVSKAFPHVVLFPGTIAWTKKTSPGSSSSKEALAQRQQGGTDVYSSKDLKAFNEAQKARDKYFLARNTCYVMHKGKVVLEYHKRDNGNEVSRESDGANVYFVHGASDSVFDLEGLSFGLKICAEVGTGLPRLVDVQVVISASREVSAENMQLKPGGYCGHADAVIKPTVTQEDHGKFTKVDPGKRRRGGGPITRTGAQQRITQALDIKANPALVPDSKAYAEKMTEMRGRARYYRLDYDN